MKRSPTFLCSSIFGGPRSANYEVPPAFADHGLRENRARRSGIRIIGSMLTMVVLGFMLLSVHNARAQEPALRIDVAHPPAEKADVRVGLYTSASNWLDEQPVHGMLAPATDTLTTVIFESLPSGVYGAAIYLDENRNGELDRSFIGLFKEPYGFSKEARVRMGPPRWDDAIFEITSEPVRLYVRLD